ncbi:MAG: hypothetical protein AAFU57_05455 [Bacteroidota bacterium]
MRYASSLKKFALVTSLLFACTLSGQTNNTFLRVYNLKGKKIHKGKIVTLSDSALIIVRRRREVTIPVSEIGAIRTKRSAGNTILQCSIITAAIFGVAGVASSEDSFLGFSPIEGAAFGSVVGFTLGSVIGGIGSLDSGSSKFQVNGDPLNWEKFRKRMENRGY